MKLLLILLISFNVYAFSKDLSDLDMIKMTDDKLRASDSTTTQKPTFKQSLQDKLELYEDMYTHTQDVYLLRDIAILNMKLKNLDKAYKYVLEFEKLSPHYDALSPENLDLENIKVDYYAANVEFEKAVSILKNLSKVDDSFTINSKLGGLYQAIALKDDLAEASPESINYLKKALAEYKVALSKNPPKELKEALILQMFYLHFDKLKDRTDALNLIDGYMKDNDCVFCGDFLYAYNTASAVDDLVGILQSKFSKGDMNSGKFLLDIYLNMKDKSKLLSLLKDNKKAWGDDYHVFLSYIYANFQEYKLASEEALQAYKVKKDSSFLGLEATYRYELLTKKNKRDLKPIISSLKESLDKWNSPNLALKGYIYNFLGYLLIDHDIDVKSGLNYVSEAVAIDPTNPAYIDSLAWGFYKNKEYKKAKNTFGLIDKSIVEEEPEMLLHQKSIFKDELNKATSK
ncbi:hypothetical protein BKH43_07585 [Helicobacter sp. 13S00401-1]|uniref:hypothetical protein n=1 Tax=Helicobacter sp. 13S00401-1 TaxID=1905758 RepID=UPI000BA69ADB|nr:hypothetical protein [Helicobacter sp. 13S00401-1]PAF48997.1 hypothetical protein BKH43_07585 [Helicobacter sp. 13S00401-1]